MKILVLGVGRVGHAIARDLAADPRLQITVVDRSPAALDRLEDARLATLQDDCADPATAARLAVEHDLVVGALPASAGYRVLEAVIDAGVHAVDISFFPEDPLDLDGLARQHGVTAVVDAGLSPGLSNVLLGHVRATAERVERFVCYVGGLPFDRSAPFEYKAAFSPIDVLELYTRPARYRERGQLKTAAALSAVERVELAELGELEAFLTDGLRTVLQYDEIPEMREMTLRYPGHARQMEVLRRIGLFDAAPVDVDGVTVSPRALLARLLFPHWEFAPNEPDLTALVVELDHVREGRRRRRRFELVDRYDDAMGISSMARTTGYTCTAVVRLVADGTFREPGIIPPERIGADVTCFGRIIRDLQERGVTVVESEFELPRG